MSMTSLLYLGILVLGLVIVGLILTILELRRGEPHHHHNKDRADRPNAVLIPADDRC